jgi:hypothetical protein
MIGIIPRPIHGIIDYVWSLLVAFAPDLFGFSDEPSAVAFHRAVGGGSTGMAVLTRYELGLIKVIPFNMHLTIDLVTALLMLAAPWLFGYGRNDKARSATLGFAVSELAVLTISKRDKR